MREDRIYNTYFLLFISCFLFSALCSLPSVYAACDQDDKECVGDLIINRYVLDDPIYRNPSVPLLIEKKDQKTKQLHLRQDGLHNANQLDQNLPITRSFSTEQAIQNTLKKNQARRNNKNKFNPKAHLAIKSGMRIIFPAGVTQLDQNAQASLNRLIKMLQDYPEWRINLHGYAGSQVNYVDQMRLAFDRVQLVKNHLVQRNVEPNRLHLYVVGASNDLPYDRVDITMIKK